MKKYIIVFVVIGLLVSFASPVRAQTESFSQALDTLLLQIKSRGAMSQTSQRQDLPALRVGVIGPEVTELQQFLKKEGYFPSTIKPTGYFGNITKVSLEKFQIDNKIIATTANAPTMTGRGEFNDVTREFIKYQQEKDKIIESDQSVTTTTKPPTSNGGGTIQLPAGYSEKIQLLSPNGGETWQIGGDFAVQYAYEQNPPGLLPAKVLVYLEQYHPPGSPKFGGVNSSLLLDISGDPTVAKGTISPNLAIWPGPGSYYKVRVCAAFDCQTIGDSSDGFITLR